MNQKSFTIVCLGFLIGIAGYYLLGPIGTGISCMVSIIVMAILRMDQKILASIFLCISVIVGFLYADFFTNHHASKLPESFFNKSDQIIGTVVDDPDLGLTRTQVTIKLVSINGITISSAIPDRVLVTLASGSDLSYGDQIYFVGKLQHPESFTTDTDREFDYPHYLQIHDVYETVHPKTFRLISSHASFLKFIFSIKKYFVHSIVQLFPDKSQAGLFAGIVIGEKSLFPANNLSDFQIAGLTHMIVLSGYNITIVALAMITILAWCGLGYRARRFGALVAIPIFVVMTGLGASSVRAAIMSMMVFVLQIVTRPVSVTRVVLVTLVSMVVINPPSLVWDPSLHLSFLAFLGLAYASPMVGKLLQKSPELFGLRDLAIETIGVQIVVLPYLLWMSGRVSILLFFANFLTVPLTPVVMGLGFAATIISMIPFVSSIGWIISFPVKILLSYIINIAHIAASIHEATFLIPVFSGWWMIGIYACIAMILGWYHSHYSKSDG